MQTCCVEVASAVKMNCRWVDGQDARPLGLSMNECSMHSLRRRRDGAGNSKLGHNREGCPDYTPSGFGGGGGGGGNPLFPGDALVGAGGGGGGGGSSAETCLS